MIMALDEILKDIIDINCERCEHHRCWRGLSCPHICYTKEKIVEHFISLDPNYRPGDEQITIKLDKLMGPKD